MVKAAPPSESFGNADSTYFNYSESSRCTDSSYFPGSESLRVKDSSYFPDSESLGGTDSPYFQTPSLSDSRLVKTLRTLSTLDSKYF